MLALKALGRKGNSRKTCTILLAEVAIGSAPVWLYFREIKWLWGKGRGIEVSTAFPLLFVPLPFWSWEQHPKSLEKGESNVSAQKTLFDHHVQRPPWWSSVLLQPDGHRDVATAPHQMLQRPLFREKTKEKIVAYSMLCLSEATSRRTHGFAGYSMRTQD